MREVLWERGSKKLILLQTGGNPLLKASYTLLYAAGSGPLAWSCPSRQVFTLHAACFLCLGEWGEKSKNAKMASVSQDPWVRNTSGCTWLTAILV